MMDEFVLSLCPFVECLKFHGLRSGWGSTFPWFGSLLLHDSSWLYFPGRFISAFKSLMCSLQPLTFTVTDNALLCVHGGV
jgi:hypothetical protein